MFEGFSSPDFSSCNGLKYVNFQYTSNYNHVTLLPVETDLAEVMVVVVMVDTEVVMVAAMAEVVMEEEEVMAEGGLRLLTDEGHHMTDVPLLLTEADVILAREADPILQVSVTENLSRIFRSKLVFFCFACFDFFK